MLFDNDYKYTVKQGWRNSRQDENVLAQTSFSE